ncbi:hypothetical protein GCM10008090_14660 [Arenicella chitinivorans]|uniref:Uncharacterized protein n=1 Tax=Arenicella chitinivorans TaxID=1329800 RepID=A0A918VL14_9GAMM|nr:hypothetical protein GCM10008090_14660 [Arenicella chitinivorans]
MRIKHGIIWWFDQDKDFRRTKRGFKDTPPATTTRSDQVKYKRQQGAVNQNGFYTLQRVSQHSS